jgi:hypothetical protein
MVLLKRNLEGPRVHLCAAACTAYADLQELYLSKSGVLLLFLPRRHFDFVSAYYPHSYPNRLYLSVNLLTYQLNKARLNRAPPSLL